MDKSLKEKWEQYEAGKKRALQDPKYEEAELNRKRPKRKKTQSFRLWRCGSDGSESLEVRQSSSQVLKARSQQRFA